MPNSLILDNQVLEEHHKHIFHSFCHYRFTYPDIISLSEVLELLKIVDVVEIMNS